MAQLAGLETCGQPPRERHRLAAIACVDPVGVPAGNDPLPERNGEPFPGRDHRFGGDKFGFDMGRTQRMCVSWRACEEGREGADGDRKQPHQSSPTWAGSAWLQALAKPLGACVRKARTARIEY